MNVKHARAREKSVYRLLLVGKIGSGKSATGNFILGRQAFKSINKEISVSESTEYKILVVDTPGLFNKTDTESHMAVQIQDSIKFLSPGPHAFLIVLNAARVTEDDEMTFVFLKNKFGTKFFNHAIIILTHIDLVKNIKQFLHEFEENEAIKPLLSMCRRRIITINNNENDMEIIQRERDKLMLMVEKLTENGMQYYQDESSVYEDFLHVHVKEWPDTLRDKRKFQEDPEELNVKVIKKQNEMANRLERENLTKKMEEALKITRDKVQERTATSTFLHTAVVTLLKIPAAIMEATASVFSWITQPLQTSSDILKDSKLENEDEIESGDNLTDTVENFSCMTIEEMSVLVLTGSTFESEDEKPESGDNLPYSVENSRHGTLEEMSEPDASKEFESSLKKLILHLQISLQRTLDAKRKECILRWKESSYPETIIKAVREINKAKTDRNWEDCMQKTNATVEMIETFPPNELPEKQELLTYIYSYFSPTSVENGDFTKTIGEHDKDRICTIEKLLKTLPEEKYPYEAALLYFEITMRYLALQKSFENRESFKSRSMSAARKAKDEELQLFGTVLFVLAEWMASTIDIGPAEEREHLFRFAFSMERSLQLAQCLDDRVATEAIQTIVQQVEIRCKRPYPKEIDHWIRRKLSKKIKYPWIKTPSPLDGSSSPSLKIKNAIRHGDVEYVQHYLENQMWEHEDELTDCLNYSLAFCDGDGKQTMSKHFITWICKELTKSHQPDKVLVWAGSIAKNYSTDTYLVLVCNYWGYIDQKFKDKCFFGLPVIYQEYNTVSDEEQSVQCSKTFLETALSPIEAMHANQIMSEITDWLMNTYSNLEVIKPCHVRSTLLEVKKEICIVLYCRTKGFIPFGECQFPSTLSAGGVSFPTDVREGFYVPAMFQESAERQNDSQLFRMGYSMGPHDKEISATVGPFVKMEGNNVGFLTCAHAFGVPCNIQDALEVPVVHPANGEFAAVNPIHADESICGYVDRIVFDINPDNPVNVDASLIRLKPEKIPNKGRFARNIDTVDPNRRQLLSFDHGEIMTKENIEEVLINPNGKIIKVGAASGVTSSNLLYNGRVAIRIHEAELLHKHGHIYPPIQEGTRSYFMKGQYLIRCRPDTVFLIAGDSGSGVFYIDQSQRLRCIGIAIGYLSGTYEAVVTPIEDVLRALGLDENALMRFPVQ